MKALKSFLKKYCGVKREISGNIFVGGKVTRYFVLSLPFASRVQLATNLTKTSPYHFSDTFANCVKASMGGGSRV